LQGPHLRAFFLSCAVQAARDEAAERPPSNIPDTSTQVGTVMQNADNAFSAKAMLAKTPDRIIRIDAGGSLRRLFSLLVCALLLLVANAAAGQQALQIRSLAERTVSELPRGELFWRIENYPSTQAAHDAAGDWSLIAEAAGRVWLFTLGAAGGLSPGATKVAEVGPISRVTAPQYLLRINEASGPPGSVTPVHSHPGSEAFFVLDGEQSIRGPHGTMVVKAGSPEAGHGADVAMQISSSGSRELESLVMFVVDATQPFSSPASLP
jgi:hypothetical protein